MTKIPAEIATPEQVQKLERVVRRRRSALCHDLDLPPTADDATILAKAPGTVIETAPGLVASAIDRAIEDLDEKAEARLGRILARAVRRSTRETRLAVFELLSLGDLD